VINNQQTIAGTFNNHLLSVTENINVNNTHSNTNRHTIIVPCNLCQKFLRYHI
jgi:hypothetical protein